MRALSRLNAFQVQFFGVVLFAAGTFAVVAGGPPTSTSAAAAVLLSGAAGYTLASGILVPGLALVLGLWVGRPRWYLIALLATAIGWPAFYLWGYQTPHHHSDPLEVFSNIPETSSHFSVQIGGPFIVSIEGRQDFAAAAVLGTLGVALLIGGLVLTTLGPAKPQQEALATLALTFLDRYC